MNAGSVTTNAALMESAHQLSVKINDYVAQQAKTGRTVSVAQAEAELRAAANRRT